MHLSESARPVHIGEDVFLHPVVINSLHPLCPPPQHSIHVYCMCIPTMPSPSALRHMQGGSLPPQAPAPPVGYVSSTMVSDLETDLPDEDEEEEDEEEDEGYGARHPRGIEHTPGSSMDNLDSSLTGEPVGSWVGARPYLMCSFLVGIFLSSP